MNNANKKFREQMKSFKSKAIAVLLLELMILTVVFTVKASMMIGGEQEAVEKYAAISQTFATARYDEVVDIVNREPISVESIIPMYAGGDEVEETVVVDGEEDFDYTEEVTAPESTPEPEPQATPNNIDWEGLKAINGTTTGWIRVSGTEIDYPVVQHTDNEKYLHYAFDGTKSDIGAIYADYRYDVQNEGVFVLWGHNMGQNKTVMFSQLKKFLDPDFFAETPVIEFDRVGGADLEQWEVLAVVPKFDTTANYVRAALGKGGVGIESGRAAMLEWVSAKAIYTRDVEVGDRQIMILGTCDGGAGTPYRLLIYAVKVA